MTQALSSNLMCCPSARRTPLLVLTITTLTMSPFLTAPFGIASLTAATTMSPIFEVLRNDPPNKRNTLTLRAPELSATTRLVSFLII